MEEAERLKKGKGYAIASLIDPGDEIEVKMVAREEVRHLPRRILAEIIEARLNELFQIVGREIAKANVGDILPGGIVLTGGTSLLPAIDILAEKVLNMPTRVGFPKGIKSLPEFPFSPLHSTAVGLVLYAYKYHDFLSKKSLQKKNLVARFFSSLYNYLVNFWK